jgi:uncharacterized protein YndB with AHSA1/START domain
MSRVIVTRVVPAPADAVWNIFTDLAGRASWLSEVDSVEVLTPGELRPDTRWRETRVDARGARVTEELVIIEVEPGHSLTMALAGSGESSHLTYVFSPIDVGEHRGGTAVTAIVEIRPHGLTNVLLAFLLGGLAARTAEGHLREELDALAAAARTRGPSPGHPESTAA